MANFGAMMSIQIRGVAQQAMAVVAACRLFTRATSLGGVESLIEHRASNEPAGTKTPDNLLRISIGLEDQTDLLDDLSQALDAVV
jgi:cystathionine gamma-synthase